MYLMLPNCNAYKNNDDLYESKIFENHFAIIHNTSIIHDSVKRAVYKFLTQQVVMIAPALKYS